jgi:predicted Zn-dependent protease
MRPHLAAIAVLLVACGQSADQQLEHARRQLKAGDHRTAVEQARAVLAKDESVLAARLVLAEAQLASGSFDDAVADFERALKGGLPPTQVIPGLAKALSMSGQAVQVITRFGDQSLGEVDAQARLDALLIEAWLATGDLPAAQARATRAIQASPQHHAVLIAHARTLIQQGLPQDATKLLDREAGASPDFAEAWALLGELRVRAGQVTEARLAFDKAVQADARNVTAYAGLMELDLASRDQ